MRIMPSLIATGLFVAAVLVQASPLDTHASEAQAEDREYFTCQDMPGSQCTETGACVNAPILADAGRCAMRCLEEDGDVYRSNGDVLCSALQSSETAQGTLCSLDGSCVWGNDAWSLACDASGLSCF
jgi:hypothetical protein